MNPLYSEFRLALGVGNNLEKLASADDDVVAPAAAVEQARLCDQLFDTALKFAADHYEGGLPRKEAAVSGMTRFMLSMRDTYAVAGEKLAASPEAVAAELMKLSTAVYVDQVIAETLTKLSGAEYDDARLTQLLGREYAVGLMRSLLA